MSSVMKRNMKRWIVLFFAFFLAINAFGDEFIKYNMEKAMYLIDDSGLKQYNNLKENGYFLSLIHL